MDGFKDSTKTKFISGPGAVGTGNIRGAAMQSSVMGGFKTQHKTPLLPAGGSTPRIQLKPSGAPAPTGAVTAAVPAPRPAGKIGHKAPSGPVGATSGAPFAVKPPKKA